jgi:hypothetical protein
MDFIDLPIKSCHGSGGQCFTSYTIKEWNELPHVGERGPDEVRQCRACGELMFMDKAGLERLGLSIPREQYAELHPNSDRPLWAPSYDGKQE